MTDKPNQPIPPDPSNPNPFPDPHPPQPAVEAPYPADAGPVAQHVIRDLRQLLQNAKVLQDQSDDLIDNFREQLAKCVAQLAER